MLLHLREVFGWRGWVQGRVEAIGARGASAVSGERRSEGTDIGRVGAVMKYSNVSQARNRFLELVRMVEDGEPVLLLCYGQPAAALISYEHYEDLKAVLDAKTDLKRAPWEKVKGDSA